MERYKTKNNFYKLTLFLILLYFDPIINELFFLTIKSEKLFSNDHPVVVPSVVGLEGVASPPGPSARSMITGLAPPLLTLHFPSLQPL